MGVDINRTDFNNFHITLFFLSWKKVSYISCQQFLAFVNICELGVNVKEHVGLGFQHIVDFGRLDLRIVILHPPWLDRLLIFAIIPTIRRIMPTKMSTHCNNVLTRILQGVRIILTLRFVYTIPLLAFKSCLGGVIIAFGYLRSIFWDLSFLPK